MTDLQLAVDDFLAQRRIAVAGVSRTERTAPANLIYRKLRDGGYAVFAVNPHGGKVEGDSCAPNLAAIEGGVDGVVVATRPEDTDQLVRECVALGIARVWMHRSFGQGSVSEAAVRFCREHGIRVIAGACPMMYCEPDFGHKCMRWMLRVTGGLPKPD
jgi:predicted CoA-binding protein